MPQAIADAEPLYCPGCGFDLRATQSNRCGECGLEFDRATLAASGIPWAHRRRIGRVRAYFKTVWQFTVDRRLLRHEAVKPQELSDGHTFARITGCALEAALLLAYLAIWYLHGNLQFLEVTPPDALDANGHLNPRINGHLHDLSVPWSAGAAFFPVLPIGLILLGFWWAAAQRFVFRLSSPLRSQRAMALSCYVTAPLILVLPGVLLFAGSYALEKMLAVVRMGSWPATTHLMLFAGLALLVLALLGTVLRTGQWLARTGQRPVGKTALRLVEWICLCALGAVVLIGLIPWCIGLVWIAIDSLR